MGSEMCIRDSSGISLTWAHGNKIIQQHVKPNELTPNQTKPKHIHSHDKRFLFLGETTDCSFLTPGHLFKGVPSHCADACRLRVEELLHEHTGLLKVRGQYRSHDVGSFSHTQALRNSHSGNHYVTRITVWFLEPQTLASSHECCPIAISWPLRKMQLPGLSWDVCSNRNVPYFLEAYEDPRGPRVGRPIPVSYTHLTLPTTPYV